MKYLSLFILIVLMTWSWKAFHQVGDVTEEVHTSLQSDLRDIISKYVKEKLPNSKNIHFDRLWTQTLSPNKVKATFAYSFDDNNSESTSAKVKIDGYAILNRTGEETGDSEVWGFDELYILNNHVDFKDAIMITPTSGE